MAFENIFNVGLMVSFLDRLTGPSGPALERMGKIEKQMIGLQKLSAGMVGLGAAVGEMGSRFFDAMRAPVRQAANFEEAMTDVRLALDPGLFKVDTLAQNVTELSQSFGLNATEMMSAQALFEGFPDSVRGTSEAMIVNRDAAKLAKVAHMDFTTALSTSLRILKAYDIPVGQLNNQLDVYAKSQLRMTAGALGMLATLGAETGLSLSYSLAATKTLEQISGSTDEAAGGVDKFTRSINDLGGDLFKLGGPSQQTKQNLGLLGGQALINAMHIDDEGRAHINLGEILEVIGQQHLGLQRIQQVFGQRYGFVINTMIEKRKEIEKFHGDMLHARGELDKHYLEVSKEELRAVERLGRAWDNLRGHVGTPMLETYGRFFDLLGSGIEKLDSFIQRHQTLAKAVLLPLTGISALLVGAGTLLTGFGFLGMGIATGIKYLTLFGMQAGVATSTMWALTSAILANPLVWFTVGAAAAGIAIYELDKNWNKFKADVEKGGPKLSAPQKAFSFVDWFFGATPEYERREAEMRAHIAHFFENLGKDALSAGANLWHSFVQGMETSLPQVWSSMKSVGHDIMSYLPWHSPAEQGPLANLGRVNLLQPIMMGIKSDPLISRLMAVMGSARDTLTMGGLGLGMEGAFMGTPEMAVPGVGGVNISISFGDINIEGTGITNAEELTDVFAKSASMKIQSALRGRFRL